MYGLLKPHVMRLTVCDPRRNALLKDGNKSDRIDARKLAELLYLDKLKPVYHGEHGTRTLKEPVRCPIRMRTNFADLWKRKLLA